MEQTNILAGIDIGGTKCAVSLAKAYGGNLEILDKISFPTIQEPNGCLEQLINTLDSLVLKFNIARLSAIGISCGSPLNSKLGLVQAPPNLPLWIDFDIVSPFEKKYNAPAKLQNDANACALAEWQFGAGRGFDNLVFLTCGTGFGAGIILDGKLYAGKNDMAGEIGHIQAEPLGPFGYGKYGSFEGFCSGSGIARYAQMRVTECIEGKRPPEFCKTLEEVSGITAKTLGMAAEKGDPLAIEIITEVGKRLGMAVSLLIDLLNPEAIILGSIYCRQRRLLEPVVKKIVEEQCLYINRANCLILPAELEEKIGDYAALSIAACLL